MRNLRTPFILQIHESIEILQNPKSTEELLFDSMMNDFGSSVGASTKDFSNFTLKCRFAYVYNK